MLRSIFCKTTKLPEIFFVFVITVTCQELAAQEKTSQQQFESLQLHALSVREGKGASGEGMEGLRSFSKSGRTLLQREPDSGRSLYITDPDLLTISLSDVMNSLARQIESVSDGSSIGGRSMFRDWWKSAAPSSAHDLGDHPGCDDFRAAELNPASYDCDAAEAKLRYVENLDADFKLITIVNRGDLSDISDSQPETCGEYRLVFEDTLDSLPGAGSSGAAAGDEAKLFLSFEFELPNAYRHDRDNPMCLAIQRFFYSLSDESLDKVKIAGLFRQFFLDDTVWMTRDGVLSKQTVPTALAFGPVVSPWNLGMPHVIGRPDYFFAGHPLGRIATNTKTGDGNWRFRAYQFRLTGTGKHPKRIRILPAALPGSLNLVPLSKSALTDKCLTVEDVIKPLRPYSAAPYTITSNLIDHLGSDIHPCFRSLEMKLTETHQSSFKADYNAYQPDKSHAMRKLTQLATVGAEKRVFTNAHLMSCSGCHGGVFTEELKHLKSDIAPAALKLLSQEKLRLANFVHSNAVNKPLINAGSPKSIALETFFLPFRKAVMMTFLNGRFDKPGIEAIFDRAFKTYADKHHFIK